MLARIAPLNLFLVPLSIGCMSGPAGLASKVALENAASTPAHAAHAVPVTPATAGVASPVGPPPVVTEQQAMQQIAPLLGKLAAEDAKLHTETLNQLTGVEPSLWSLTVQRAVNTLEYRQQLAGQTPKPTTPTALAKMPANEPQAPAAPPAPSQAATGVVQTSATLDLSATPDLPAIVNGNANPETIGNPHFKVASKATPTTSETPRVASRTSFSFPTTSEDADELNGEAADDEKGWREHLSAAIATLDREAALKPKSSSKAYERVRLQLLQLVAGDEEAASQATPGLSTDEQGYWSKQIYALATLLSDENGGDHRSRADAAARHLMEASAKLRSLGSLQVDNFVTCREVYGYGAYDPMLEARYAPGDQVILYAEIDNYQSDETQEGYRTTIASSYRLVSLTRNEVVGGEFPEVDDLCLTRRRDFHIQYGITLPSGLSPGDYRLELTVEDKLGRKKGHDQLPLTITER